MKKVLIALDYNPSAQKVAETGFSFTKTMKAEITLLHVLSDAQDYTLNKHVTAMESVTEKVLQNTTIPILIIPTKKQSKS